LVRGAFLAGVLATAVALAALWVASSAVPGVAFPPAAVAEAIVRTTPGDIATMFIELLGPWALRLLTVGVVVGTLLAGGWALSATSDGDGARPGLAALALGVLGAVASAAGGFAGVSASATITALALAAATYAGTASALVRAGRPAQQDAGRRRVLALGAGAFGLAVAGGALGWLTRRLGGPDTNVELGPVSAPAAAPERAPWPRIEGLSKEVTSAADHYVVDINLVRPVVEAGEWRLRVTGEVEQPLELGFSELQRRFEMIEEYSVLTCVSNEVGGGLVGHSLWGGVRLRDVLEEARLGADAVDLVFRAADGYSDSIPVDLARDPGVLLTVAQNRRPLTQEHGFPCRLRVPPIYGMKNVKWLEAIEVVRADYSGYWQQRGWSDAAGVRTQSRIDVAGDDGVATLGRQTWIAGVAWAGDRGIRRVEVSFDDGHSWREAQLRAPTGPLSWRQWALAWTPRRAGTVNVTCRATDGRGRVQTARPSPPHPAGATGLHSVSVEVA
jgi:DMSO/TMAO reductase YedYZ molybdopterin-dependent catalytic subunit